LQYFEPPFFEREQISFTKKIHEGLLTVIVFYNTMHIFIPINGKFK